VTTKRAGVGLRSEARYLFAAMKAICREMNDQRLRNLHVPLMGSGHGGLECELALLLVKLVDGQIRVDQGNRFNERGENWISARKHNHLRLTRIPASTRTLGLEQSLITSRIRRGLDCASGWYRCPSNSRSQPQTNDGPANIKPCNFAKA
jgi:hypothetical protein